MRRNLAGLGFAISWVVLSQRTGDGAVGMRSSRFQGRIASVTRASTDLAQANDSRFTYFISVKPLNPALSPRRRKSAAQKISQMQPRLESNGGEHPIPRNSWFLLEATA